MKLEQDSTIKQQTNRDIALSPRSECEKKQNFFIEKL